MVAGCKFAKLVVEIRSQTDGYRNTLLNDVKLSVYWVAIVSSGIRRNAVPTVPHDG